MLATTTNRSLSLSTPSPATTNRFINNNINHSKKKNMLVAGMIRIVPVTSIDHMFPTNTIEDNSNSTSQTKMTIDNTSPALTQNVEVIGTNTSTPFSFRKGGGGDLLYDKSTTTPKSISSSSTSPLFIQQQQQQSPSIYTTPSSVRQGTTITTTTTTKSTTNKNNSNNNYNKNNNNKSKYQNLWLIPIQKSKNHTIGQLLYKQLVSDCYQLVLQPIGTETTTTTTSTTTIQQILSNQHIVQRLIIAHCIGRYVQLNERITISFQGRAITFCITHVQSSVKKEILNCTNNDKECNTSIKTQQQQQQSIMTTMPLSNTESNSSNNNNNNSSSITYQQDPAISTSSIDKIDTNTDIDSVVSNLQNKLIISETDGIDNKINESDSSKSDTMLQSSNDNTNCDSVGGGCNSNSTVPLQDQLNNNECITIGSNVIQLSSISKRLFLYKITYETNIKFVVLDDTTATVATNVVVDDIQHNRQDIASTKMLTITTTIAANDEGDCMLPTVISSSSLQSSLTMKQQNGHFQPLVAGLDDTIQQVRSFLEPPLLYSHIFTNRGMRPPRGVLLYGPSGVGKTCLARQIGNELSLLKSSSSSSYLPTRVDSTNEQETLQSNSFGRTESVVVQYVHCAELQSKTAVVGDAERELARLFTHTNATQSSKLLILDDIHLICPRRGGPNNHGNTDRLASTLLALMDGINTTTRRSSNNDIIVILGITTNPSVLDPALRRSGRLDTEIEVPIPEDVTKRAKIIEFHLRQYQLDTVIQHDQEQLLQLGQLAKGFNGADCMLAVKEAIRMSIVRSRSSIQNKDGGEYTNTDASCPVTILDLQTAIRSIHPSAIKSITVEIPKVLWSDIGGMDTVKRELRDAIEIPTKFTEYYEQLNIPKPRGILLYGPPGCSKTLMAKALATESSMNFLAVKGPELLSKWLGESERALASLFRRARMASPAIIFFDEIDAIACKRGSGSEGASNRLLSQLLTELDGVNNTNAVSAGVGGNTNTSKQQQQQQRVIIVGATNRPDLLDSALTRPGRIDRMIYVGVPDQKSRKQIFQITLEKKVCSDDIDLNLLASDEVSHGFSGAEIVAICRDAAFYSLEEQMDKTNESAGSSLAAGAGAIPILTMKHLLQACRSMQRQITPAMLDFYKKYRDGTRRKF